MMLAAISFHTSMCESATAISCGVMVIRVARAASSTSSLGCGSMRSCSANVYVGLRRLAGGGP